MEVVTGLPTKILRYPCTDILEKNNDIISTENNNHNLDMETRQEHLKQFLLSSHYQYGRRAS